VCSMPEVLGREAPCWLSFELEILEAWRTIEDSLHYHKPKPEDFLEIIIEDARIKRSSDSCGSNGVRRRHIDTYNSRRLQVDDDSARARTGACSFPSTLSHDEIGIYDEHWLPEQNAPSEEEGKQR
jgi:hypothetical protein